FYHCSRTSTHLSSFPTRRSSDLNRTTVVGTDTEVTAGVGKRQGPCAATGCSRYLEVIASVAAQVKVVKWLRATAKIHGSIAWQRSEGHTSELQSRGHLVCRLLLE